MVCIQRVNYRGGAVSASVRESPTKAQNSSKGRLRSSSTAVMILEGTCIYISHIACVLSVIYLYVYIYISMRISSHVTYAHHSILFNQVM